MINKSEGDQLKLANISSALAIQHNNDTYIVATGQTLGIGGTLKIVKSLLATYPPRFIIYAIPGKQDNNVSVLPVSTETVATLFNGRYDEVLIRTADRLFLLHPTIVSEEYSMEDRSAAKKGTATVPTDLVLAGINILPKDLLKLRSINEIEPIERAWAVKDSTRKDCFHIHVYLRVIMPTPGYKIYLKIPESPNADPNVFVLEYDSEGPFPPGGFRIQVLTPADTYFIAECVQFKYQKVYITKINKIIDVDWSGGPLV